MLLADRVEDENGEQPIATDCNTETKNGTGIVVPMWKYVAKEAKREVARLAK